ncbi:hypothetical protein N9Z53_03010 [Mariniblastus sp.]|nr:hypothetical protein [Mariniblastus sp.]MDB4380037.1 hypothetical protein [Mariniblastus sp.]
MNKAASNNELSAIDAALGHYLKGQALIETTIENAQHGKLPSQEDLDPLRSCLIEYRKQVRRFEHLVDGLVSDSLEPWRVAEKVYISNRSQLLELLENPVLESLDIEQIRRFGTEGKCELLQLKDQLTHEKNGSRGRPPMAPQASVQECKQFIEHFKDREGLKRVTDIKLGKYALENLDSLPDEVTQDFPNLEAADPEKLGKRIKQIAKSTNN